MNVTWVAPVKLAPLSTTTVLATPFVGVKEVITGAGITTKLVVETPVLMGVVREIEPVVAPAGTIVVI